ncbi:MAG: winged helix-turn-helix domain-containing protein [Candidatus Margulisiibacteriota bacterium]
MLERLFGNQTTEKILFFLLNNTTCYAKRLSDHFKVSLFTMQQALLKLEKAGILISFKEGNIRYYDWNPRYPLLTELQAFLKKGFSFLPPKYQLLYLPKERTRPRRTGKPFSLP